MQERIRMIAIGLLSATLLAGNARADDDALKAVQAQLATLQATLAATSGAVGDLAARRTRIDQCQTLTKSGHYVLTKALQATGDCIVLGTSFIILDLNGLSITGNGTGSGITDGGAQQFGIVVRNGSVLAFGTGVNLSNSIGSHIERVTALSNSGSGIVAFNSSVISDCIALDNGGTGIAGEVGVEVTGCVASGNSYAGIFILMGTLTRNTANANGNFGIGASDNSTFTGNTASNNPGTAFSIGLGSTVTGNTASTNMGTGFAVTCPSNLQGNTATNNAANESEFGATCVKANNLGF